jgi:REP element-mobilizing transposase RayT
MVRPLRIIEDGGIYHITARGVERRPIFRDEADRCRFLELLGRLEERYGLSVGGYALMGNHYHLVVRLKGEALSRAVQWLQVSYSSAFNRRHRRSGHLFQGRFHAHLLEPEAVWSVMRYVHLNPVRVSQRGLGQQQRIRKESGQEAVKPSEWQSWKRALWQDASGSFGASVGRAKSISWLHTDWWLDNHRGSKAAYIKYVEEALRLGLPETPWEQLWGQAVIGSEEFFEKIRGQAKGNRREQPALQKFQTNISLEQMQQWTEKATGKKWGVWKEGYGAWERLLYCYASRILAQAKLREIGQTLGIDYSGVSWASIRFERGMKKRKEWSMAWNRLVNLSRTEM